MLNLCSPLYIKRCLYKGKLALTESLPLFDIMYDLMNQSGNNFSTLLHLMYFIR